MQLASTTIGRGLGLPRREPLRFWLGLRQWTSSSERMLILRRLLPGTGYKMAKGSLYCILYHILIT